MDSHALVIPYPAIAEYRAFRLAWMLVHGFSSLSGSSNAPAIDDNLEEDIKTKRVAIMWDRFAMDENGYHVGYESFTARPKLLLAKSIGWNCTPDWCFGRHLICLGADVPIKIALPRAKGYYGADQEFAWQEFMYIMDPVYEVLKKMRREFDRNYGGWMYVVGDTRFPLGTSDYWLLRGGTPEDNEAHYRSSFEGNEEEKNDA